MVGGDAFWHPLPSGGGGTAAGEVGGPPLMVRKAADESVTSSTTEQSDDHLKFAVGTSQVWFVEITAFYTAATAADIVVVLDGPSGTAFIGGSHGLVGSATTTSGDVYAPAFSWSPSAAGWSHAGAGSPTLTTLQIWATVTTAGTAGDVVLKWAQGVSSGTATTIKAGSMLKATRIS